MMLQSALRASPIEQAWRSLLPEDGYKQSEGKVIVATRLTSEGILFHLCVDRTREVLECIDIVGNDYTCWKYTDWEPVLK